MSAAAPGDAAHARHCSIHRTAHLPHKPERGPVGGGSEGDVLQQVRHACRERLLSVFLRGLPKPDQKLQLSSGCYKQCMYSHLFGVGPHTGCQS